MQRNSLKTVIIIINILFFHNIVLAKAFKPASRWSFDEKNGTTVQDIMKRSPGKITGLNDKVRRIKGHVLSTDDAVAANAIYFNGKGGYVNCGRVINWSNYQKRTFALWVKKDPGKQPNAVLLYQAGKDHPACLLSFGPKGDGTDLVAQFGSAKWEGSLSEPVRDNIWTHIIVTYGRGTVRIYIDTHPQEKTANGESVKAVSDFIIGQARQKKNFFKGAIDDVRVWNYAHQGIYFVMPRHKITLPDPEKAKYKGTEWYRGKAFALRIPWNIFLQGGGWKTKDAGKHFNGKDIAQMAVDSGACGVIFKMRAPNGFPAYPSKLNPSNFRPERDFAMELVEALKKKGLRFAPNLSQENIDAMAKIRGVSKAQTYYDCVNEIMDRYQIKFYQFRFDGFWGQGRTYDPEDYEHQRVFELFRNKRPETMININRFIGTGAEDMGDIETSRPRDQLHYWEQEDFYSLEETRWYDWGTEVETPMGDDWATDGLLTSMPPHHLINKLSVLSAMGITTVLGFGPDVYGRFNDIHKQTCKEIGKWLIPRRPYLDDSRPNRNVKVKGYKGLWFVNNVHDKIVVHLITGSRLPVKFPESVAITGAKTIKSVKHAPKLITVPFKQKKEELTLDLKKIKQGKYTTILVLTK